MNENWNPEIPLNLQQNFKKEKEQAFTLYLDFVVDATASMYTVFPAVYYAAAHFLECLSKYEVYPQIGLTLIRNEENGEETETEEAKPVYQFTIKQCWFLQMPMEVMIMKNIFSIRSVR